MRIRQETQTDYNEVFKLIEKAFKRAPFSNHKEQFLVDNIRKTEHFIPELSIVAELNNKIVGYILLTKIYIKNNQDQLEALALAPVAVLPEHQNKRIGTLLINYAHNKARELNYKSIILIGHETFYPKFGYKRASMYNIQIPFNVPDENALILELQKDSLKNISGIVEYPQVFYN